MIHTTADSAIKPESDIQYEGYVDTMKDNIPESMGFENGNICDDYDLTLGRNIKCTTKFILCLIPLKNSRYKIYIWIYEPSNGKKSHGG